MASRGTRETTRYSGCGRSAAVIPKGGWCGSLDEPILMSRVACPLGKGPARWELCTRPFLVVCHRVWGPHLKEDNEHGPGVRSTRRTASRKASTPVAKGYHASSGRTSLP